MRNTTSLQERHFSFGNNFAVTIPPMIRSTRNFLLLSSVEMVSLQFIYLFCMVSYIKRLLGISTFVCYGIISQKAYTLYLMPRNSNAVRCNSALKRRTLGRNAWLFM